MKDMQRQWVWWSMKNSEICESLFILSLLFVIYYMRGNMVCLASTSYIFPYHIKIYAWRTIKSETTVIDSITIMTLIRKRFSFHQIGCSVGYDQDCSDVITVSAHEVWFIIWYDPSTVLISDVWFQIYTFKAELPQRTTLDDFLHSCILNFLLTPCYQDR